MEPGSDPPSGTRRSGGHVTRNAGWRAHVALVVTLSDFRATKDEVFRHSQDSPLDHEDRHRFTGLHYYADDERLRFVLDLDPAGAGSSEEVEMSNGSSERMDRAGHFEFVVDGARVRLTAFGPEESGSLFIPFRDATGRTETYPAGRYVEAEPTDDGLWVLDFNRAYNPYCAYSDQWRCPLPPAENWLTVEIRAGEKRFH